MAILGIDEVGRGPLAGPLVVGAVILPRDEDGFLPDWTDDLRDSKKVSPTKRKWLSEIIWEEAAVGLGWIPPHMIDEWGMNEALKKATVMAVRELKKSHWPFHEIIIDGDTNFLEDTLLGEFATTLVKGDDKVKEISAASIVAKVARDEYMIKLSEEYPGYGWERNVGYGTPEHKEGIFMYGLTPEHRLSFEPCKSISGFKPTWRKKKHKKNTTKIGRKGEALVAEYLEENGHEILMRNFKTKTCEIDLISTKDDEIYFTEVKTRKSDQYGGGAAAVTAKKMAKMTYGVEVFLKLNPQYRNLNPCLAVGIVEGDAVKEWLPIR